MPPAQALWLRATGCSLVLGLVPVPDNRADSPPAPAEPPGADARLLQRGRQLLVRYQCGGCHQIPAVQGADGQRGPSLAGFGRRSYIAGSLPNNAALLARWIVDPPALRPGTPMPALGATPPEATAMAAYLLSLE